jgi:hypothetical protein
MILQKCRNNFVVVGKPPNDRPGSNDVRNYVLADESASFLLLLFEE